MLNLYTSFIPETWQGLSFKGFIIILPRLVSIGNLGKERELGVGKLGWHGNFDTGYERLFRSKSRVRVF